MSKSYDKWVIPTPGELRMYEALEDLVVGIMETRKKTEHAAIEAPWVSSETLAASTGLNKEHVSRTLVILYHKNYVRRRKDGHRYVYSV